MDTKKQFRIKIWLIVLCATLIAGLTLLIPAPETADPIKFHLAISLNILNLAIFGPVVYFFFKAFPDFKKGVRVAYGCIFGQSLIPQRISRSKIY
ncbi:MAG TPA: hypothetical protein VFZ58_05730 [Candidatus Saccharimonadales bacterium]